MAHESKIAVQRMDIGIKSAFVLAGGKGERLGQLTAKLPKCMLEVAGKPILEHSVEFLVRFGISRIVLGTGYKAGVVEKRFGNGERFGVEIIHSKERMPLGTAGALKNAEQHFSGENNDTFVMMNGDEMKDFNLDAVAKLHRESGAVATIALWELDEPSAFGAAEMRGSRIVRFVEKPPKGKAPSRYINSGTYVLEPSVFELIPQGRAVSIEREVFPLIAEQGRLFGCLVRGRWMPTDTKQLLGKARKEWQPIKRIN